jgi:hypothetical protein
MKSKLQAILLTLLLVAGCKALAFAAPTPTPDTELDKLSAFVGHWTLSGELKDAATGKPTIKLSSDLTCNWSANHGFLLCDQVIHLPDGTQNDLSVYTYSEKDHAFQFFGITRGNKDARTTKVTIDGNLWTYSSTDTNGAKHIEYRTTNRFTTASNVNWRSEYSEDGTHWITTAEGTDVRSN